MIKKGEQEVVLTVEHVSKDFHLPHEKRDSIKGNILSIFKGRNETIETQRVLRDISFEVKKGEFFGILGRNGSGKSTLLKIISQIYTPTSGAVNVEGKLVPFIELGVGFNPELTGRENVYLNGALLGFSRREIDSRYDDIVEFAELEGFMDQKLKNYSSGMQVRLAFSVAIRADADILVLDEILAVGDANFQRKCNDYFEKIKYENKTVILVTHSMDAVEKYCSRAMLIDEGKIRMIGEATTVAQEYNDLNIMKKKGIVSDEESEELKYKNAQVKIVVESNGEKTSAIDANKTSKLMFSLYIKCPKNIDKAVVGFAIFNMAGIPIFATNTKNDFKPIDIKKNKEVKVSFEMANILSNGDYALAMSVKDYDQSVTYVSFRQENAITVYGRRHEYAIVSPEFKTIIDV